MRYLNKYWGEDRYEPLFARWQPEDFHANFLAHGEVTFSDEGPMLDGQLVSHLTRNFTARYFLSFFGLGIELTTDVATLKLTSETEMNIECLIVNLKGEAHTRAQLSTYAYPQNPSLFTALATKFAAEQGSTLNELEVTTEIGRKWRDVIRKQEANPVAVLVHVPASLDARLKESSLSDRLKSTGLEITKFNQTTVVEADTLGGLVAAFDEAGLRHAAMQCIAANDDNTDFELHWGAV